MAKILVFNNDTLKSKKHTLIFYSVCLHSHRL